MGRERYTNIRILTEGRFAKIYVGDCRGQLDCLKVWKYLQLCMQSVSYRIFCWGVGIKSKMEEFLTEGYHGVVCSFIPWGDSHPLYETVVCDRN